jgi:hypothetical protein
LPKVFVHTLLCYLSPTKMILTKWVTPKAAAQEL